MNKNSKKPTQLNPKLKQNPSKPLIQPKLSQHPSKTLIPHPKPIKTKNHEK
jgi:hypothetical protein